jgi:hypothetical protein
MFQAEGVRGELRVGYRVAARLGRWSLLRSPETLGDDKTRIRVDVIEQDEFWSTQGPQEVWLNMGGPIWWIWPTAEVGGSGSVSLVVHGDPRVERT